MPLCSLVEGWKGVEWNHLTFERESALTRTYKKQELKSTKHFDPSHVVF